MTTNVVPGALRELFMAGAPGFEPGLSVLETDVLAVDTMPLQPARNSRAPLSAFI